MPVFPAADITDKVIDKRLLDFSHNGEDPRSRTLQDQRMDFNNPPQITAIESESQDNVITIVVGQLADRYVRENGQRVRGPDQEYLVEKVPGTGTLEIGIGADGWIEVTD